MTHPQIRRRGRWRLVPLALAVPLAILLGACLQAPPEPPDRVTFQAGDGLEHAPGVTGELVEVTLLGPDDQPVTIRYEIIDGLAIVGGDMIIGTADELASLAEADRIEFHHDDVDGGEVGPLGLAYYPRVCWKFLGITLRCKNYRWPSAVVPYTFRNDWDDPTTATDENAMMRARILDAIAQIEAVTAVRFVPRTSQSDYVRFQNSTGCSSWIGRQGGRQAIKLNVACDLGAVVHEILHALGLGHEHQRHDRDQHVEIHWDNIQSDRKHNFQRSHLMYDMYAYDYDSIMHYRDTAFCKRPDGGGCVGPTITTRPPGTPIGTSQLSSGDIRTINALYRGEPPTIAITKPAAGARIPRGTINIVFDADVYDPEGMVVTVLWTSDLDGYLGHGTPSIAVFSGDLSYGTHVVDALAYDPQGNTDSDSVTIVIQNTPPEVTIDEPLSGATFCVDEMVLFRATVIDINEPGATLPDESVEWFAGILPFAIGKTATHRFTVEGLWDVSVRATDPLGATGWDSVTLIIQDCTDQPPVVEITTPADDLWVWMEYGEGLSYADVTLVGNAFDPEDGWLTGDSLAWTTDRTHVQPALLGTGTHVEARLYSDLLAGITHTVTLTATDSAGNTRSAMVRITLRGVP